MITSPIGTFKTGTYTVTRTVAGTYDANGRLVAGSSSTFPIDASITPVDGRTLQNLPEAQHGEEVQALLTTTALIARQPGNAGDRVEISSESWEVIRSQSWSARGKTFTQAYIARKATS